jgi:4-amino-4-deoxy-L-arabinose transferase-like glycosyltransferase
VKKMFVSKPRIMMIIFVVAFLVRLLAVLALRDIHSGPTMAFGADGIEFNELAHQVALGHGYELQPGHPTAFRAPGFPLFLAGIYFLAGQRYPLAYLVFCALGATACVLTFLVASELLEPPLAVLAAFFSIIYTSSVYDATVFASENLFVVCLGLSIWLFLRYLRRGSFLDLFLSAVSIGWGILTRPFALLLIPLFVSVLLFRMWKSKRIHLLPAVLCVVIPLAMLAPWTIRNYEVFHRFDLEANNGGSTFYGGNNDRVLHDPHYYGGWISTTELPYRDLIDATPNEIAHDKEEWHLGIQWVESNARSMPLLCSYKLVRLWLPDIASDNRKYVVLQLIGTTPLIVLTLIGLFRCLSSRRYWTQNWVVAHGVMAATVLTALIFWGSPRFRDANLPVLMVYAAVGVRTILPRKAMISSTRLGVEIVPTASPTARELKAGFTFALSGRAMSLQKSSLVSVASVWRRAVHFPPRG